MYNGPLLMNNSPLLGYNSLFATDISGLIYVDRMIIKVKSRLNTVED